MKVVSTLWSKLKGVWQRSTAKKTSTNGPLAGRPFKVGDIVVYYDSSFSYVNVYPNSLHRIMGLYRIPEVSESGESVDFILISKFPFTPLHPSRFRHADELSEIERLMID